MTQPIISFMDKLGLECGERQLSDYILLGLLYLIPHIIFCFLCTGLYSCVPITWVIPYFIYISCIVKRISSSIRKELECVFFFNLGKLRLPECCKI